MAKFRSAGRLALPLAARLVAVLVAVSGYLVALIDLGAVAGAGVAAVSVDVTAGGVSATVDGDRLGLAALATGVVAAAVAAAGPGTLVDVGVVRLRAAVTAREAVAGSGEVLAATRPGPVTAVVVAVAGVLVGLIDTRPVTRPGIATVSINIAAGSIGIAATDRVGLSALAAAVVAAAVTARRRSVLADVGIVGLVARVLAPVGIARSGEVSPAVAGAAATVRVLVAGDLVALADTRRVAGIGVAAISVDVATGRISVRARADGNGLAALATRVGVTAVTAARPGALVDIGVV